MDTCKVNGCEHKEEYYIESIKDVVITYPDGTKANLIPFNIDNNIDESKIRYGESHINKIDNISRMLSSEVIDSQGIDFYKVM